ncbi:hypothetical protein COCON_G00214830 [Conger conger]|uniref:Chemokine interleukin-8-like domain-containing protein n=1 Tax=Conger conger TaxID=82655 RepID=A0A9Q1HP58_CONCO|nr:monocyte chemotactic protein 1B-like [Conger conger]KAJ8252171.1 hypothetical protein COCON_G00214830 [Conger conger]
MSASRLTLLSAAVLLLVCATTLTEGLRMASKPRKCCFDFAERQFPLKRLQSYKITSQLCSNQAVMFKTHAGKMVCARPSQDWVKDYMQYFDKKNAGKPAQL